MLCTNRQVNGDFRHAFVSRLITEGNAVSLASRERTYAFPLYLYAARKAERQQTLDAGAWSPDTAGGIRVPNLNPAFVEDLAGRLGLAFVSDGAGDLTTTFGPEDVLHYIYAILHAPTYRARYAEFLKIDFPRIPLTSDTALFRTLCGLGRELVGLHLLESAAVTQFITRYPVPGEDRVEKGYPKYAENDQRVYINKAQYFQGVPPEVWEFRVGGYQVCDKWLKDRRGRQLTYEELTHYQKIVVALHETIRLMEAIDEAIPEWPVT